MRSPRASTTTPPVGTGGRGDRPSSTSTRHWSKCTDEHNRKLIVIGTRLGAAVLFQRYVGDSSRIVYNLPYRISRMNLVDSGLLNSADLQKLLGTAIEPNVAYWPEVQSA